MTDEELIKEMNKVLTLEHGHLGMYKDFMGYKEKAIRRAFRRFTEIEVEHINKLRTVMLNLGAKPSLTIEGGDIIGHLFGVTVNLQDTPGVLRSFSFIEKKSHQGYMDFITKLEEADEKRTQFIAEFLASNMLEAQLMHLWLEEELKNYN